MNTKSKKDLLTLGLIGVGAIALASQVADSEGENKKFRLGGKGLAPIFPIQKAPGAPPTPGATNIYMLPGQGEVTFPSVPLFDINSMIAKTAKFISPSVGITSETYNSNKKGLLTPSPATGIVPYLYTGGNVEQGAYTHMPSPATGIVPYLYTGGEVGLGAYTEVPKKSYVYEAEELGAGWTTGY